MSQNKKTIKVFQKRIHIYVLRNYLSITRVRNNLKRSREYVIACFLLFINEGTATTDNEDMKIFFKELALYVDLANKIKQMKKKFRNHRAALGFIRVFA